MTVYTIFTQKKLEAGTLLDVYSPSIPDDAEVVFKRPTDPLNPIARGRCIGSVPPLLTPSKGGEQADVNRFYKRFQVTEET